QAQSVPLSLLQTQGFDVTFPPKVKVIAQCLKGKRGETSCAILSGSHQCDFYNIEGGIEAWIADGLPVIGGGAGPKFSIFRQVQMIVGSLIALMVLAGFGGWSAGFAIAGIFGAALAFAGLTGWCGLAMALQKMPWNK
ncbi:MAG: rhodanese family protein, partial [Bdellovibrionales bacterium]